MRKHDNIRKPKRKTGFSLVELVVVIIIIAILAVAVFAGGAAVIAKARTERAVSDLNNFERAISTYMFEKTKMVKMDYSSGKAKFDQIADDINDGLPQEYQLDKTVSIPATGAISSDITGQVAYVSDKKDPWGNNYWLLMDTTNRNTGSSEYFITVMSAGKNGKANVGGLLDGDDIFLLTQYSNGEVATKIYKMQEDTTDGTGSPLTKGETALTPITGLPSPRNIGENARDVAHVHSWVVDSQTAATCTAAGVQHRRCTACGETEDVNLPAVGHNLTWTTTKQATCTENGMKRGSCTRCSYSTTETIASPGHHTYGGWTIDIAATCTQTGERSRVCTVCSHKETEPIPTSGSHSWGAWTTETAATCVAGGTEKHTCTRSGCGASETRATDPLDHNWKSVTKAATCTEAGYTQDECQRAGCSATQNKTTITALGHSYGSWATVTAATCTAGGTEKRTCTRTGCTAYETRTTAALEHSYGEWTTATAATCTAGGTEKRTCTRSGCADYETRNTDALGHSYGEWTTATAATCTAAGTEKRTCTRTDCTTYETRNTDPLGHEWVSVTVDPTYMEAGYSQEECTVCHTIKNWQEIEKLTPYFLTFSSDASFSLKVYTAYKSWGGYIEYTTNPLDESSWKIWDPYNQNEIGAQATTSVLSGESGHYLYLRGRSNGTISNGSSNYRWVINATSPVQCDGNIEVLRDWFYISQGEELVAYPECYSYLFAYNTMLTKAPDLPAKTVGASAYHSMFRGCTNLIDAPDLPATTVREHAYASMFYGCTGLRSGPVELPATEPDKSCYFWMFANCTNLVNAPRISAQTLQEDVCYGMFENCTSLVRGAEMSPSAITGNRACCRMYKGCSSLQEVPDLTATNLEGGDSCYSEMFKDCTGLVYAPGINATNVMDSNASDANNANYCFAEMFAGCTNLEIAPYALLPQVLPKYACQYMFKDCPKLRIAPILHAITIYSHCYFGMFENCTSLTSVPSNLYFSTTASHCCYQMFKNCTGLTEPPAIRAITTSEACYQEMFYGCSNLIKLPSLPATKWEKNCYYNMFYGCSKIKISGKQEGEYTNKYFSRPSAGYTPGCSVGMFSYTGGTFQTDPLISRPHYSSYYTSNEIVY